MPRRVFCIASSHHQVRGAVVGATEDVLVDKEKVTQRLCECGNSALLLNICLSGREVQITVWRDGSEGKMQGLAMPHVSINYHITS